MKKLYLRPSIEVVISESVVMDTDSHGWTSGGQALAKPNQPMFDWEDDYGQYNDLWGTETENNNLW